MLCRRCLIVMETGTEYYPRKNEKDKGYRRFYKCKKCHKKLYTKESNFQELIMKSLEKSRNR